MAKWMFAAVVMILGVGLLAFATGATFGQRCSRAYPDSALEQERCVYRLKKGEMP